MIEIDGSYGEGGGQMLRSSLALSILTGRSVHIRNIRAGRSTPGLKPQHHSVISLLQSISDAKVDGLKLGSTEITFQPGPLQEGSYAFDVGTAGSMVLIFQSVILSCVNIQKPMHLKIKGGTDVKWAPSWDYFTQVFLQALQSYGLDISYKLESRGYYPKGGGLARITIQPLKTIHPLIWDQPLKITDVYGIIHSCNLPDHIAKRMKHTCLQTLMAHHLNGHITTDHLKGPSSGTGITLFTKTSDGCIGSVGLGERGIPAETIAKQASNRFVSYLESGNTVDPCLFDQLLPFLVLGTTDSILRVDQLSNHAKTQMWLMKQFLPDKALFETVKIADGYSITIQGQHIIDK